MVVAVEFDNDEWTAPEEWARMYRRLGLQVVPAALPTVGGNWKRPIVDWVEFQNTLAPQATFDRWYGVAGTERNRKNMGLICGAASGRLVVVDLDIQKGPEAMRWLRALLEVHNNGLQLDTWVQATGGGGLQFFFRAPEGWTPPTFKASAVHVDIRGQGGFVVCPPSLHETGNAYAWEPGYEPWDAELAECPPWLIEAIEKLRLEHGGQPTGREHVAPEGAKNAFGLDTDGREHKMLQAVWGAVVDLYRDVPIPPPTSVQEAEIERLWGNYERTTKTRLADATSNAEGLEREGRGLGELRRKWAYAMGQWDTKVKEAAGERRPFELVEVRDTATGELVPAELIPAPFINVGSWEGDPPERRWIVPEWIVQGAVNSLYGDGGLGKTLLAQQLAYSVSMGLPWLGLETTRGRVLGVFCEDDEGELMRRHAAIKANLGFPVGNPFKDVWLAPRVGHDNTLVRFGKDGLPQLGAFHAELVGRLEEVNPSLLILDTLADVYAGNELDRPSVNYFCKTLLGGFIKMQQARGFPLTVLLLGHPSVSGMAQGGRGYSGSTAWNNAVRARMYLTRPEDEGGDARLLTRGKANYAKSGDETAVRLRFEAGVLGVEQEFSSSYMLEEAIKGRVADGWRRGGSPYTRQVGHVRNIFEALPADLSGLGYPAAQVRATIRALEASQTLVTGKRGGRSGVVVAGEPERGGDD